MSRRSRSVMRKFSQFGDHSNQHRLTDKRWKVGTDPEFFLLRFRSIDVVGDENADVAEIVGVFSQNDTGIILLKFEFTHKCTGKDGRCRVVSIHNKFVGQIKEFLTESRVGEWVWFCEKFLSILAFD